MNATRISLIGFLLIATPPVGAATTQWGVSASTSYADCSLFICDKIGLLVLTPIIVDTQSGGLNQSTAAQLDVAQIHDTSEKGVVDMGIVSARVDLDPNALAVPVLKAKAASNSLNGWVGALAFGIQGYQYTGNVATTINLAATLTGNINNPDNIDATALSVGIWLLSADPGVNFPNPPPASLADLVGVVAGLSVADFWEDEATTTGAVGLSTGANPVSILVNPGDEFFLMAALVAGATGSGDSADAFSTLTMHFDSANLLPATAVPTPAAAWLFISALLGICKLTRRAA